MNHCPWNLKDVLIVFLYAVALFFVFCFWMSVVYFLARLAMSDSSPVALLLKSSFWSRDFMMVLLFYLALLVAMKMKIFDKYRIEVFAFFVKKGQVVADILYGIRMYLKFIAVLIAGTLLVYLAASVWDMVFPIGLFEKLKVFFIASELEGEGLQEKMADIYGFVTIFALGPFFEELFFRGCLYRALRRRLNYFAATGISGFVFALLHGYFFLFLYVFLVGILLAALYEKRESLVAPLAFHMLNNLVVIILFLFGIR